MRTQHLCRQLLLQWPTVPPIVSCVVRFLEDTVLEGRPQNIVVVRHGVDVTVLPVGGRVVGFASWNGVLKELC